MWSLRNIYFYLVCFVSIILIIVGLITTVNAITELAFPDNYYESKIYYDENEEKSGINREEFIAQREKEIESNKQNDISRRKRRVFDSLAMVLVAFPFYIYHWKKIQQDQILSSTK